MTIFINDFKYIFNLISDIINVKYSNRNIFDLFDLLEISLQQVQFNLILCVSIFLLTSFH